MPKGPNQSALALALGCSRSRVAQMKAAGMPVNSIEAARRWKEENVRPRVDIGRKADHGDGGSLEAVKKREILARARRVEMDIAEKSRDLVRGADVWAAMHKLSRQTRDTLQGLPVRIAPVLFASATVVELELSLEKAVRDCLTDAAKMGLSDLQRVLGAPPPPEGELNDG